MRALQLRRARDGGPEKRAQRASHCGRWTGRCRRWRAWTEQARAPGFAAPLAPARTASAGPKKNGGEGGIRTPGALLDTLVFETSPFGRSGTSPPDLARSLPPARSNAVDLQAIRVEAICSAPGQRNRSAKPVSETGRRCQHTLRTANVADMRLRGWSTGAVGRSEKEPSEKARWRAAESRGRRAQGQPRRAIPGEPCVGRAAGPPTAPQADGLRKPCRGVSGAAHTAPGWPPEGTLTGWTDGSGAAQVAAPGLFGSARPASPAAGVRATGVRAGDGVWP